MSIFYGNRHEVFYVDGSNRKVEATEEKDNWTDFAGRTENRKMNNSKKWNKIK